MIVLGINGSVERTDEKGIARSPVHDSSATLVRDGEIVAAAEEERFNRFKHTGKLPKGAIQYCLRAAGIDLGDVDRFVFNALEEDINQSLAAAYTRGTIGSVWRPRPFIQHLFLREFDCRVDPSRFEFLDHHYAHAASAFLPSGFDESLVLTMDGTGSGLSGSVWMGRGHTLTHRRNYDGAFAETTQSLGHLYLGVTFFLGFKAFDEYKVMGLAPYGDRDRLRPLFDQLYTLGPDGDYAIHLSKLDLLERECAWRTEDAPIEQIHKDIAAALQAAIETLALHVIDHHRRETGTRRLCFAGGVAHNCALNGTILRSGRFDEIFVQPASHDGGLSMGAALHGYFRDRPEAPCVPRLTHVSLGPRCTERDDIACALARWRDHLSYTRVDDVAVVAARMIADGAILGWVQGRAEFGPRALGHRSILADPRPARNKDIINAMIKKREAFRPFAPSVIEERAAEFFELPSSQPRIPFMVFVVSVEPRFRDVLGAVTHVDGTARIQTVARATDPLYWRLLHAFGELTGLPILLNTSFNNNAEPIVNSVEDAIVTFLTTDLPHLVVGDYVVGKRGHDRQACARLALSLPAYMRLHRDREAPADTAPQASSDAPLFRRVFRPRPGPPCHAGASNWLGNTHDERTRPISPEMAELLARADGFTMLDAMITDVAPDRRPALIDEAIELWERRLVHLRPLS